LLKYLNILLDVVRDCFLIYALLAVSQIFGQNNEYKERDSLYELSQKSDLDISKKILYAKLALKISEGENVDSLIIKDLQNISLLYYRSSKFTQSRKYSNRQLNFAAEIEDTLSMAISNFNLASSYYAELKNDSSYYHFSKALKLYSALNRKEEIAQSLYYIADLQDTEQDFVGSEESSIRALKLFETFPRTEDNLDYLWTLNNLLGIVSMKLENLDESLKYHASAQRIANEMKEGYYNDIFSKNNIAVVYRKQNKLQDAIDIYKDLAKKKNTYNHYDPTFYPLVLENLAYTKLMAGRDDFEEMESTFQEAYRISDSLDDPITKLAVAVDFSKFYLNRKQRDSSLKYASISYNLSKEVSANEILLDALKVLSELEPGEAGKAYLNEYISLSDSLLSVERNVRNKFARIEFETDKISAENEKMDLQRKWLFVVAAVLLVAMLLLYVIVNQRAKNKQLKFEKDQQKTNEEIYNLMLSQQDKVDEARANEKKRISQDMHDGILGRLFGTRLSLDSLNTLEGDEAMMSRAQYIKELQDIENDIRKLSHDLSTDFVLGSNFTTIVSELLDKQSAAYKLDYKFDYDEHIDWDIIPNKTKISVYRIIQESLQNIYKHAQAQHVRIAFQLNNEHICLEVSDDGKGFDVSRSRKGIGIKNINSRAKEFNGEVIFESEKEKGTTIKIIIPQKH